MIVLAYTINNYHLIRVLIWLASLSLIIIGLSFKRKIFYLFSLVILIIISYGIDCFLYTSFKKIPLFSYEIKSSENISVYNSIFYRIYNCDGILMLDKGYNTKYMCDINSLETKNVNDFLAEISSSYTKYKNKFVKLNGRISRISGMDTIELNSYEIEENNLNGEVKFNPAVSVRIKTNTDLSNYRIYDDFTVIGLVKEIETNNQIIIVNLTDAILIPSDLYDEYTLEVKEDKEEIKPYIKDKNYYLYGLDNIFVKYGEDIIYELSYSINDDRISLEKLIDNIPYKELKRDEEIIAKVYNKDKFNIIICENTEKVYFANSRINFASKYC